MYTVVLAYICSSNAHKMGFSFEIKFDIFNLKWKFHIILLDIELAKVGFEPGSSLQHTFLTIHQYGLKNKNEMKYINKIKFTEFASGNTTIIYLFIICGFSSY